MAGKCKKRSNVARKAAFKSYKDTNKLGKNTERKLSIHLLKHPNDKQATSHTVPNYTRKAVTNGKA